MSAGIPRESFRVYFSRESALKKLLTDKEMDFVLVDGNIEKLTIFLDHFYDGRADEKNMLRVIGPFDAPNLNNFSKFLERFSRSRSFAVNTMRHGAPLELELT